MKALLNATIFMVVVTALIAWKKPEWLEASTYASSDDDRIAEAFVQRKSNIFVTVKATVLRALPDAEVGGHFQKFLVRLESGHTLMVSHNVDLAPRVPVVEGAPMRIRGEYDWSDIGGVIHWTHRDPAGERDGGWIEFKRYVYE